MQTQIDFSSATYDGPDYRPELDDTRLRGQTKTIFETMRDGVWRTLQEIEKITGYPQASISAQLRHLRKPRFGMHVIEKRRRGEETTGLFEYKLTPSE